MAATAPSLEGRAHNTRSGLCWGRSGLALTGERESRKERKFPHGRASSICGLRCHILPLFPGDCGGHRPRSPDLAPGSKPVEHQASHVTSLDLSILICEIVFRFMVSESRPASTFHVLRALFKSSEFYGSPITTGQCPVSVKFVTLELGRVGRAGKSGAGDVVPGSLQVKRVPRSHDPHMCPASKTGSFRLSSVSHFPGTSASCLSPPPKCHPLSICFHTDIPGGPPGPSS